MEGVPAHPHPEPRSYPLMLRTHDYEWWRPLSGLALGAAGLFLLVPLVLMPVLIATVAIDHEGTFRQAFVDAARLETVTWQGMLFLNLSLAALVPVTWGVVRLVHLLRPRWLASVRPGIRWRFLGACFGLALVAIAAQLIVGAVLPGDLNGLSGSWNDWTPRLAGLAVVVALTTPLQAIGEEYGFRGYLLQAFGSLANRPWVGILLSAVIFALSHGVQNAPLFLDRFTFGLMAGYLVHRTGGLEAGIALHVWNNLLAFGIALTVGDIDETLKVSSIPWSNIALTITQNGVYLLLVLWMARRMGVRRTTDPVGALPPPPAGTSPVLLPTTPPV